MLKTESKLNSWREKAKKRRVKIWALEKRIKEVIVGRENWKQKYQALKLENARLQKELKSSFKEEKTKIKHHAYSAEEISFFLNLRTIGGCSLRGCLRVMQVLYLVLGLNMKRPSPSTIRLWEIKLGYAKIQAKCEDTTSDWVLIFDESVNIGSEKMLLLIGVNLGEYKFDAPLDIQNVDVLGIWINSSWKGVQIKPVIDSAIERNYNFKYCCSDNANNLRSALKMSDIIHIEDCGHSLGRVLERKYKKDSIYKKFSAQKTLFMKQNVLGKYAIFLPPKQRSKGRFMNLWSTCKWGMRMVYLAENWKKEGLTMDQFKKIKWILNYKEFIEILHKEQSIINGVNKLLKHNGLSELIQQKCEDLMKSSDVSESFKDEIRAYLKRNLSKLSEEKSIICSSDIIESIFGKLKNKLAQNSSSGLTEGSLSIANYGNQVTPEEVKKAMEEVTIVDIDNWRKDNLPESVLRRKRKLFKNTG